MLRRHFFLVAAAVALLLMVAAGAWKVLLAPDPAEAQGGGPPGGGGGPGGGRAAAVRLIRPEPRPFVETIQALGEAKARQSVTITSDTTELITRVLFTSGQFVRRGQTLVELKAEEQGADVVRAQATLAQAQRDYERWRQLGERGFAPRAEVENRQATVQEATATLRAVQARRQDRLIRAPFSGVIGLSDAAPGQLVNPGVAIATLDDLSAIHVDFEIPERYLGVIRPGLAITAAADAFPSAPLQGAISRIDTRVDPNTRAVTARAEFSNSGGRIKPGMLLRVQLEQGGRTSLAVPESAVLFEADSAYVYVAAPGGGGRPGAPAGRPPAGDAAGQSGATARAGAGRGGDGGGEGLRAQRKPIQIGARSGGYVEVLAGLAATDRVVADGVNRINPNQPLRAAGAGGPGGARAAGGAAAPAAQGSRS